MKCPYCKETIDDDSLFCDQCGKELMFCPSCKVPKRGTECPACGETLVSGKEFFAASATPKGPVFPTAPVTHSQDSLPRYLVGDGMTLEIKEGVFGRKGGIYPEFASCIFVSGRHGEFTRTPNGWAVTDLGSTNGTCLNGERLKVGTPYPIKTGDKLNVSRLSFIIQ